MTARHRERTGSCCGSSHTDAFAASSDAAIAACPLATAQWSGVRPHFIAWPNTVGQVMSSASSAP